MQAAVQTKQANIRTHFANHSGTLTQNPVLIDNDQ